MNYNSFNSLLTVRREKVISGVIEPAIMKYSLLVYFAFIFTFVVNGQDERKYIRQGNTNYNKAQFSESELLYRKAIDAAKAPSNAVFNLGDALYKQQKYDEASKKFDENFASETDKTRKANSLYNLGNSMLKSQKIEESINAYKSSLKLDPSNTNAKYNLAYAQDLLKKQEQQQQNKDQNKDQKQDQKDKQDQQDKNQQNQDNKDNKDNKDQQQQQQSISKEDAERLLSAIANDENKVQEKVKKDKAEKGMIKTLKNW
jgi:Ca-activated chloride channel family protein